VGKNELSQIKEITSDLAVKLKRRGITTIKALSLMAVTDLKELGVEEELARRILREAWARCGFGFITADQLEKVRKKQFLTTGCKALDAILGGGVQTGEITELIGAYGSGKTQTQFTILTVNLGENPDIGAIFLDSEDTFSNKRIREIAKARGYDADSILKRTIVVTAPASEQFMISVDEMPRMINEKNIKLIFLDSLIAPFRSEYVGREILWYRQQLINKLLRKLLNYATVFNLAIVVSNQVVARPEAVYTTDIIAQNPPAGGHIVAHGCATRVYFRKAGESKRIARIIDSSWLPEAECVFKITEKGIEDIEEKTSKS